MPKALSEFKDLQEARPQVTRVSNEQLLEFLKKQLCTTKDVAAYLQVENGTAFSRLRRMEKNGLITRKWDGNRAYWVDRTAVGLEYTKTKEEKPEEA